MSKIDEIKVRAYEQTKALLEGKQNQRATLQKDLDMCDMDIITLNEEILAMSTGFKSAIDAAVLKAVEVIKEV